MFGKTLSNCQPLMITVAERETAWSIASLAAEQGGSPLWLRDVWAGDRGDGLCLPWT